MTAEINRLVDEIRRMKASSLRQDFDPVADFLEDIGVHGSPQAKRLFEALINFQVDPKVQEEVREYAKIQLEALAEQFSFD